MAGSDDRGERWKLLATVVPVALAVGAALIYGLLVLAYSEFYRELGVRPSDVGVEYGRGIGGAAGITIAVVLLGGVLAPLGLRAVRFFKDAGARRSRGALALSGVLAVASVVVVGSMLVARYANSRADTVKSGRALDPVGWLGIELLAVRADPVRVEPIGGPDRPSRLLRQARDHRLFYLGRTAATVVVYDQTTQRVLQLPAGTVAIETSNCETSRNRDPACTEPRG